MPAPLFIALLLILGPASAAYGGEPALARGRAVYLANCVSCHGEKGDGRGPAAAAIEGAKPRDFTKGRFLYGSSPEEIFRTITRGVPGTVMPSWKALPEEDRRAVIPYVLSFSRKAKRPATALSP